MAHSVCHDPIIPSHEGVVVDPYQGGVEILQVHVGVNNHGDTLHWRLLEDGIILDNGSGVWEGILLHGEEFPGSCVREVSPCVVSLVHVLIVSDYSYGKIFQIQSLNNSHITGHTGQLLNATAANVQRGLRSSVQCL